MFCATVKAACILFFVCTLSVAQNASIYSISPEEAKRGRELYGLLQQAQQNYTVWKTGVEQQLSCNAPLEFTPTFELAHIEGGGPAVCTQDPMGDSPVKGGACNASSYGIGTPLGEAGDRTVVWDCVNNIWVLRQIGRQE